MKMENRNAIFYSAFLENFAKIKHLLPEKETYLFSGNKPYIFISMHIAEEGKGDYKNEMKKLCHYLVDRGYLLVADISKRTLDYLAAKNFKEVCQEYKLHMLRPDFGFSQNELKDLAKISSICMNATNLDLSLMAEIRDVALASGNEYAAMHNYYPRPETGLDEAFFKKEMRLSLLLKFLFLVSYPLILTCVAQFTKVCRP